MADDLDDIFDGEEAVDPVEPPTETQEAAAEEVEAVTEPEGQPEAEKPVEKPDMVPHAVVGELRGEIRTLKEQIAAAQPQAKPEPEKVPDVFTDPEGFNKSIDQRVHQAVLSERLNTSEMNAERTHGKELVGEAFEAAKMAGGNVVQGFMQDRDPYEAMIKWHQTTKVAAEIGNDPAKYRENLKAEILAEIQAEQVAKQVATPNSGPSLAGATNLGSRNGAAWAGPADLDDIL